MATLNGDEQWVMDRTVQSICCAPESNITLWFTSIKKKITTKKMKLCCFNLFTKSFLDLRYFNIIVLVTYLILYLIILFIF